MFFQPDLCPTSVLTSVCKTGLVIAGQQQPVYFAKIPITSWHNTQHGVTAYVLVRRTGGSCTCACSCMLESNRCRRVSPALLSHSSSSPRSGLFSGVSISRRTCRAVTQHVPILSDLVSGSADRSRTSAHSLILKWVVSL